MKYIDEFKSLSNEEKESFLKELAYGIQGSPLQRTFDKATILPVAKSMAYGELEQYLEKNDFYSEGIMSYLKEQEWYKDLENDFHNVLVGIRDVDAWDYGFDDGYQEVLSNYGEQLQVGIIEFYEREIEQSVMEFNEMKRER